MGEGGDGKGGGRGRTRTSTPSSSSSFPSSCCCCSSSSGVSQNQLCWNVTNLQKLKISQGSTTTTHDGDPQAPLGTHSHLGVPLEFHPTSTGVPGSLTLLLGLVSLARPPSGMRPPHPFRPW